MRLKDKHWMCCTCHRRKPKGWKGLCPHCNPSQADAYDCPGSRWTWTPRGRVIAKWGEFLEAVWAWIKS